MYGDLLAPLRVLGVPEAHGLGLTGTGVRIGVLAPAFRLDHDAFRSLRVVATRDFVDGDSDVGPGEDDPPDAAAVGTGVLALVAGRMDGTLLAPAFHADLYLARIGGGGTPERAVEERWVEALEWMVSEGVQVVTSALGFREFSDFAYEAEDLDGDTPLSTAASDAAASAGVVVVAPMGNGGPEPRTLLAPSDGDSVVAVGAGSLGLSPLSFSGRGPTADGRSVPVLLAPGRGLPTAGIGAPEEIVEVAGSQYAGALLAGVAALFLDVHRGRGPVEVRRALLESGAGRVVPDPRPDAPPTPHAASAILFPDDLRALPLQELSPAGRLTNLTPLFRWEATTVLADANPVAYTLSVAPDSAFLVTPVVAEVVGAFAVRPARPLPPEGRVFWRVEAETQQGVRRRTSVRGPIRVPPWVELRSLNDPGGVTVGEARPSFLWSGFPLEPPAGPFLFDLEVFFERTGERVLRAEGLEEESFRPETDLPFNQPLRWEVVARARTVGADTASSPAPFVVTSRTRPPVTILFQNFPNPFPRPAEPDEVTRIWFDLARDSQVRLAVHDLRGRLVRRLIPRKGCGTGALALEAGEYGREGAVEEGPCVLLHWDGRDDRGRRVRAGVYLLRLATGDGEDVRRIVFWP